MKNNKKLWLTFGVIQHIFSWVGLLVYSGFKYGAFVSSNGLVLAFAFALVFAVWMVLRSLKETADHGFGLSRKIARSIRLFVPLLFALVVVLVINVNLAGMVDILVFGALGNLLAIPFGVLSYYSSKQYIVDTGMVDVVDHIKNK